MGQKVNPIGLRLGINRTWDSRWFAGKNEYGKLLHEDVKIREILHKELKQAAVARIVIERPHKKCRVTIHSARPGVVIGKKGADIDKLRKRVADITASDVVINIVEIRKPELDATLVLPGGTRTADDVPSPVVTVTVRASVVTRNAMDQLVVDNLKSWFSGKAPLTPVAETPFRGR